MGLWVRASIIIVSIFWTQCECNPQLFQNQNYFDQALQTSDVYGKLGEVAAQSYSAPSLQTHSKLSSATIDFSSPKYSSGGKYYQENLDGLNANDRYAVEEPPEGSDEYQDHKTSPTTNLEFEPQLEFADDEHFNKPVPEYTSFTGGFGHHQSHEKHGEVHYHQHKHVHKHKHEQEHKHQHKNEHQHKHAHKQEHKHDHHSGHKHEHQHKHDHSHGHKHDHHNEHKHDHKHGDKHNHHHGHKHEHHNKHKHLHHHMNKHGHKHGHHHKHSHHHSKHH